VTSDDLEARVRERCEADVRYNAALTALDQAVVTVSRLSTVGPQNRELLATALMQFLQQITGFVETKDRELAAVAATRVDQVAREIQSLLELRTHIGVLQRAMEMLKRSAVTSPAAVNPQRTVDSLSPATSTSTLDDYKYVGFEDAFRGSDAAIEARLRAYVPLFKGRSRVLDIGCGWGEMLSALKDAGTGARGIDLNGEMVAVASDRGLNAVRADALEYLSSLPDESLDGLIATQVLEHLEPSYLMRLLDAAARTLQPSSPIVLETINPACWLAFFSSYIRDFTHVRPVHPETLQYLLRASGFERVDIQYSAPVPDHVKMKAVDLPADVLASSEPSSKAIVQMAHTMNANAAILNSLLFTYLDYAAIGFRS
jgi:2-polyprenyl-3-methyl-5-hydroxy-6-metoxy-1,4-benzoquinol methylase